MSARKHEVDRWRYIYTLTGTPEVMDEPFTLFAVSSRLPVRSVFVMWTQSSYLSL